MCARRVRGRGALPGPRTGEVRRGEPGLPGETLAKVADRLGAGTRLIWVIDSERHLARVYRADGSETHLSAAEALDGEDVVKGHSFEVGTIL